MSSIYSQYLDVVKNNSDISSIQSIIDQSTGGVFRFESFVKNVLSGEIDLDFEMLLDLLGDVAFSQFNNGTSELFRIIAVVMIAAVFTNFSFSFREGSVSDTAFYVSYVVLYGILAISFYNAFRITYDAVESVTGFMRVLVPSYCIAIVMGSGTTTSLYWYESTLVLITIAENLLLKIILPLIGMYMTVNLASNLSRENLLSKFSELLELIVRWGLKSITGLVIGIGSIQGMIGPALDELKKKTWVNSAGSIPGVGSLINGVSETMMGAGVLLKNAFGAGGVVAIGAICFLPVIRLLIYCIAYKAEAAVVQPISDKRIVDCINAASKATGMMTNTVFTAALMFILSIAIVCFTTL